MDLPRDPPVESLPAGALLRLEGGRDYGLLCLGGLLWITEEGCPDDRFVRAGEVCRFRGGGLVVVEALAPARLVRVTGRKKTRRGPEGEGEPSAGCAKRGR